MKNIHILIILFIAGTIISCNTHQTKEETMSVASVPDQVTLSGAQIREAGISLGNFQEAELSHDVNARGRLILPHNSEAAVSTMIGGIVSEIVVHIGDKVKKGTALCKLIHTDIIQAQEDYLNARYNYDHAKSQFERQKVLNRENVSSEKSFQESERNYLSAKTRYDALEIMLRTGGFDMDKLAKGQIEEYLVLRSPIDGQVDKINTNLGKYEGPDQRLFDVVNKSDLHIELMVFEKDVPLVQTGQRVTFSLSNLGDKIYEASVFAIGSTMEESARTVPVLAHFKSREENLFPGMFVAATIHTGESMFQALPENALIAENENEYYIYYTLDEPTASDFRFRKIPVKPGLIEDGFAQINLLGDLPEGALIVIEGAYYIRAEFMKALE